MNVALNKFESSLLSIKGRMMRLLGSRVECELNGEFSKHGSSQL